MKNTSSRTANAAAAASLATAFFFVGGADFVNAAPPEANTAQATADANEEKKKVPVVKVDKDNFKKEIQDYDGPVVIAFSATWCGPCRMLAPELEKFGKSWEDGKVAKIDFDYANGLDEKHPIRKMLEDSGAKTNGIPTLYIIDKDENAITRWVAGGVKADLLEKAVPQIIEKYEEKKKKEAAPATPKLGL